jgi:hypothetical protein
MSYVLLGTTEGAGSSKLKLELTEANPEYKRRGAQNTNQHGGARFKSAGLGSNSEEGNP